MPIFHQRVSPRFDCAKSFLVVTVEGGQTVDRFVMAADGWTSKQRVQRLLELQVDQVWCGGIDLISAQALRSSGLDLQCHLTGNIEDLLQQLE
ncbi:NifB/NifX family molybdenum-iron cluster-binding protein [Novipirellula artificiosorum]|uniref:Uncharacterized protein n=1 Tax=Novipirellula artificiosorum TaxID=2528016 RepID=A0A5C6E0T5_9BACT|nr:NifB/NifX family molybdenum-iron cluster-binding protein [Novipirellula artificiosorum]TWU40956.1 hypothetical protein Poly41_17910 [Novipirellula artificiosorum]